MEVLPVVDGEVPRLLLVRARLVWLAPNTLLVLSTRQRGRRLARQTEWSWIPYSHILPEA